MHLSQNVTTPVKDKYGQYALELKLVKIEDYLYCAGDLSTDGQAVAAPRVVLNYQ